MVLSKILFCFSCSLLPCFAASFSFGESIDNLTYTEIVELITANKEYCIRSIQENKTYLKTENIFKTKEGTFLRFSNHFLVKLPVFFLDEAGYFIPSSF